MGEALGVEGAPPAEWEADRTAAPGPRVWVAEAADGRAEADGIAAEVRRRKAAGRPYREQAVLVRTHANAEPIVAALEREGIPVLYLGDLFVRGEVRDLLALLALVADGDRGSLLRIGAMAEHRFARPEGLKLIGQAQVAQVDFPEALSLAEEASLEES